MVLAEFPASLYRFNLDRKADNDVCHRLPKIRIDGFQVPRSPGTRFVDTHLLVQQRQEAIWNTFDSQLACHMHGDLADWNWPPRP